MLRQIDPASQSGRLDGSSSPAPVRPSLRTFLRTDGWRLALLGMVLAAFAWRTHGLTSQSLWRDEVDALYFALRTLRETLAMIVQPAQNGPLYFLALRPWLVAVGTGEFALRYPSVMASTLSIPLLWQVARRLTPFHRGSSTLEATASPADDSRRSEPVALLAALFLAFNPYQLWYSQEGKMYTVVTLLALLATWLWLSGITRGGWKHWLGYLLTVTVAMYVHLLMILLLPVHLVWMALSWPQSRRHWLGYLLAMAGLTLPYIPFLEWHWAMLVRDERWTGFNFVPLDRLLRTLILNHSRGFLPPGDLIWLAPIFFLGLAGLVMGATIIRADDSRGVRLAPWRRMSMVVVWLLIPILAIYLFSLRQPIFTDRYIIWIAPAALLLLALGVQIVERNAGVLGRPLAWLLVIYTLAFWLYAGWQQKSLPMKYDLRSAVGYVTATRAPEDLLLLQIPHLEYSFRYYSSDFGPQPFLDSERRLAPWHAGLWTNNGLPDEQARLEVDQQMQSITADHREIWLLRSEVEMWDQRRLMDEWLEQHGDLVDGADFHGVQVRHYRLTEQ